MAGLKAIKTKIRSVAKTRTVTKAMEAVSAAKMRKAQQKALGGRAYARAAASVLARVAGSDSLSTHPLAEVRSVERALYIVITSDKGLAGALNSGVLRLASADIAELSLQPSAVDVAAIGRKAGEYFERRGYAVQTHPNTDAVDTAFMNNLLQSAAEAFTAKRFDVVKIVYQNFLSTFEQRPTVRTLFPLSVEELQHVVADIVPARGVFAQTPDTAPKAPYTVEPSEEEVLGVLIPKLAGIFLYHALLETQASEHSARMVAMKSASDKASEKGHALTLSFNKARQAAITREVSEIIGGMEAVAA